MTIRNEVSHNCKAKAIFNDIARGCVTVDAGSGQFHDSLGPSTSPAKGFEPLLDDRQAAELLGGLHPKTLQRLARTGKIPAYRVGRFWRYRASELDLWLRSRVISARQPARVDFT